MSIKLQEEPIAQDAPPLSMTYEQFLEWADEDTYAEWVNGEVVFMSPVSLPHQDIAVFLSRLMAEYAEQHQLGRVLTAPFQMRLSKVKRGREPDLMYVAKADVGRLMHTYLDGPASLAVEIVSPESRLRDRGEKYAEYEQEGVREYWIIDPELARADFFVLSGEGQYERARPDSAGLYHSTILSGLWLKVGWLWQSPLPTLRAVLSEWEQGE